MTTRQNTQYKEEQQGTAKKVGNMAKDKEDENITKKIDKEVQESLDDVQQSLKDDALPRYFNMDEIKEIRRSRMCKFYAHHLECQ